MVETCKKVLFLTGAPVPKSLNWEEDELSAIIQPCFLECYTLPSTANQSSKDIVPLWRSLPLEQPHLPTGLTQPSPNTSFIQASHDAGNESSFLSTSNLSFISASMGTHNSQGSFPSETDGEQFLSQYYNHSFALHEGIPSSQIIGHGSVSKDDSYVTHPEKSSIACTANSALETSELQIRSNLMPGQFSDLKDMPNAAYIYSINPQTMTVNLVVGIISISQPRTIKTRRARREVDLVEIIVGDNTRAGFCINMWLPLSQESNISGCMNEHLRDQTMRLRPKDIVVAKQIALCSFRGKVYGQSLRRGLTTLDLLYRNVVDKDDERGVFSAEYLAQWAAVDDQILKVKYVKDWVMEYVGSHAGPPALTSGPTPRLRKKAGLQALPNDTP